MQLCPFYPWILKAALQHKLLYAKLKLGIKIHYFLTVSTALNSFRDTQEEEDHGSTFRLQVRDQDIYVNSFVEKNNKCGMVLEEGSLCKINLASFYALYRIYYNFRKCSLIFRLEALSTILCKNYRMILTQTFFTKSTDIFPKFPAI